jgi:formylglycine-generating enzyme required for sulfatase activity
LCTQPEWERAARGADGRNYPGGEVLDADDANIDVTYGRDSGAYGPDEVGAHPRSDSPFGAADMAGNVFEWVRGPADAPMTRGGSWYHGAASAIVTNRDFGDASLRDIRLGIRICADAEPAR